jgi:hypothetical protein
MVAFMVFPASSNLLHGMLIMLSKSCTDEPKRQMHHFCSRCTDHLQSLLVVLLFSAGGRLNALSVLQQTPQLQHRWQGNPVQYKQAVAGCVMCVAVFSCPASSKVILAQLLPHVKLHCWFSGVYWVHSEGKSMTATILSHNKAAAHLCTALLHAGL